MTALLSLIFSFHLFSSNLYAHDSQIRGTDPGDRYAGPIDQPAPMRPPRPLPPRPVTYFDWGFASNGYTYCFEWSNGYKTTGQPVPNHLCEQYAPSYYYWGRAVNGYGACYQFNSNGYVLNTGYPVYNFNCEQVAPSYYGWGPWNYCYQFTPNGYIMNNGQVFPPGYCY